MHRGVFSSYDEVLTHRRGVLAGLAARVAAGATSTRADGWSVAQALEHLAIVAESALAVVRKLIGRAESRGAGAAPFVVDVSVRVADMDRQTLKTRAQFDPAEPGAPAASLVRLAAVQDELASLAPRLARVDPAAVSFPHWLLGPMTLAEWVAFIGLHEERHLERPPFAVLG